MKRIGLTVALGALTVSIAGLSSCGLLPEKGWILYQTSPFGGDQTVYISRDGVKCVNQQISVTSVVRTSDPKIIFYNDKTKVYAEMTPEQYKAELKSRQAGVEGMQKAINDETETPLKKAGDATVGGIKATEFIQERLPADGDKGPDTLGIRPKGKQETEFYFADNINVPPAFSMMMSKSNLSPERKGVLLRMVTSDNDGKKMMVLDTSRFERQDLPPETFNYPTGYKRVANDMEVMMGEGAGQAMDALFKEFAKPEAQKAVKDIIQAGQSAAQYMKSVDKDLRAGKVPRSKTHDVPADDGNN